MKATVFPFLIFPLLMLNLADRSDPGNSPVADPGGVVIEDPDIPEHSSEQDSSDFKESASPSNELSVSDTSDKNDSNINRFNEAESAFHGRLRETEQQLSQSRF